MEDEAAHIIMVMGLIIVTALGSEGHQTALHLPSAHDPLEILQLPFAFRRVMTHKLALGPEEAPGKMGEAVAMIAMETGAGHIRRLQPVTLRQFADQACAETCSAGIVGEADEAVVGQRDGQREFRDPAAFFIVQKPDFPVRVCLQHLGKIGVIAEAVNPVPDALGAAAVRLETLQVTFHGTHQTVDHTGQPLLVRFQK
ncbi:hypothetical protein D3C75_845020 [compost metagenome]